MCINIVKFDTNLLRVIHGADRKAWLVLSDICDILRIPHMKALRVAENHLKNIGHVICEVVWVVSVEGLERLVADSGSYYARDLRWWVGVMFLEGEAVS